MVTSIGSRHDSVLPVFSVFSVFSVLQSVEKRAETYDYRKAGNC